MTEIADLIKRGKPQPPSKFIVMGDPMTGKTTLAAKSPRPLFLSTDGNAAKAGLDAIDITSLPLLRDAIGFFSTSPDYETLVIDTIEGVADLFEKTVIDDWNVQNNQTITALNDIPYGKLTGQFNRRMAAFSETLWALPKNIVVITYTKRQVDDVSGSIVLSSELKSIRQFTKFTDGLILTIFDGEKYRANVVSKRTVMAGAVAYGSIEPFLRAAGWELPTRKTKVGSTKKG